MAHGIELCVSGRPFQSRSDTGVRHDIVCVKLNSIANKSACVQILLHYSYYSDAVIAQSAVTSAVTT